MDFQIRITDAALTDFEEILSYSWVNFPATAGRFGNGILDHIDLLRRFPRMGQPVAGGRGMRRVVHSPIAIYYTVRESPDVVEVIRIIHVARHVPKS